MGNFNSTPKSSESLAGAPARSNSSQPVPASDDMVAGTSLRRSLSISSLSDGTSLLSMSERQAVGENADYLAHFGAGGEELGISLEVFMARMDASPQVARALFQAFLVHPGDTFITRAALINAVGLHLRATRNERISRFLAALHSFNIAEKQERTQKKAQATAENAPPKSASQPASSPLPPSSNQEENGSPQMGKDRYLEKETGASELSSSQRHQSSGSSAAKETALPTTGLAAPTSSAAESIVPVGAEAAAAISVDVICSVSGTSQGHKADHQRPHPHPHREHARETYIRKRDLTQILYYPGLIAFLSAKQDMQHASAAAQKIAQHLARSIFQTARNANAAKPNRKHDAESSKVDEKEEASILTDDASKQLRSFERDRFALSIQEGALWIERFCPEVFAPLESWIAFVFLQLPPAMPRNDPRSPDKADAAVMDVIAEGSSSSVNFASQEQVVMQLLSKGSSETIPRVSSSAGESASSRENETPSHEAPSANSKPNDVAAADADHHHHHPDQDNSEKLHPPTTSSSSNSTEDPRKRLAAVAKVASAGLPEDIVPAICEGQQSTILFTEDMWALTTMLPQLSLRHPLCYPPPKTGRPLQRSASRSSIRESGSASRSNTNLAPSLSSPPLPSSALASASAAVANQKMAESASALASNQWRLLFRASTHGFSMNRFTYHVLNYAGPTLLVLRGVPVLEAKAAGTTSSSGYGVGNYQTDRKYDGMDDGNAGLDNEDDDDDDDDDEDDEDDSCIGDDSGAAEHVKKRAERKNKNRAEKAASSPEESEVIFTAFLPAEWKCSKSTTLTGPGLSSSSAASSASGSAQLLSSMLQRCFGDPRCALASVYPQAEPTLASDEAFAAQAESASAAAAAASGRSLQDSGATDATMRSVSSSSMNPAASAHSTSSLYSTAQHSSSAVSTSSPSSSGKAKQQVVLGGFVYCDSKDGIGFGLSGAPNNSSGRIAADEKHRYFRCWIEGNLQTAYLNIPQGESFAGQDMAGGPAAHSLSPIRAISPFRVPMLQQRRHEKIEVYDVEVFGLAHPGAAAEKKQDRERLFAALDAERRRNVSLRADGRELDRHLLELAGILDPK